MPQNEAMHQWLEPIQKLSVRLCVGVLISEMDACLSICISATDGPCDVPCSINQSTLLVFWEWQEMWKAPCLSHKRLTLLGSRSDRSNLPDEAIVFSSCPFQRESEHIMKSSITWCIGKLSAWKPKCTVRFESKEWAHGKTRWCPKELTSPLYIKVQQPVLQPQFSHKYITFEVSAAQQSILKRSTESIFTNEKKLFPVCRSLQTWEAPINWAKSSSLGIKRCRSHCPTPRVSYPSTQA